MLKGLGPAAEDAPFARHSASFFNFGTTTFQLCFTTYDKKLFWKKNFFQENTQKICSAKRQNKKQLIWNWNDTTTFVPPLELQRVNKLRFGQSWLSLFCYVESFFATMYVHHTTTTTATSSFDTHHCSSKREPVIKVATWNLVITSLQFSRSPLCLPQLPAESATHFISILSLRVHGPPLPAHSVEQVISQRAESHRATFLSAFWSLFPSSIPS